MDHSAHASARADSDRFEETAIVLRRRFPSGIPLKEISTLLEYEPSSAGFISDVLRGRASHVAAARLEDLRRRLGMPYDRHHLLAVAHDHTAAVHLQPGGEGEMKIVTVPDDAQVVIVPRGARIVHASPRRPALPRRRIDITSLSSADQERVRQFVAHLRDPAS